MSSSRFLLLPVEASLLGDTGARGEFWLGGGRPPRPSWHRRWSREPPCKIGSRIWFSCLSPRRLFTRNSLCSPRVSRRRHDAFFDRSVPQPAHGRQWSEPNRLPPFELLAFVFFACAPYGCRALASDRQEKNRQSADAAAASLASIPKTRSRPRSEARAIGTVPCGRRCWQTGSAARAASPVRESELAVRRSRSRRELRPT